ncbi:MAG: anti-sigma factor family protein [Bacillota bacterium]
MSGLHPDEMTLHDYLFGELESEDKAHIEAHLADCRQCAAQAREMLACVELVKMWGRRPAPAGFLRELRGKLVPRTNLLPLRPVLVAWLGAAVAFRVWEMAGRLTEVWGAIGILLPKVAEALSISATDAIGIVAEVLAGQWLVGTGTLGQLAVAIIGVQLMVGLRKGVWVK